MIPSSACQPWLADHPGPCRRARPSAVSYTIPWDTIHFILSINDLPEVREVFSGFKRSPVSLTYAIHGGKGTPAKELIVAG